MALLAFLCVVFAGVEQATRVFMAPRVFPLLFCLNLNEHQRHTKMVIAALASELVYIEDAMFVMEIFINI
jgi:hypothetical protein